MSKLEIKHIAKRLPYGLQCHVMGEHSEDEIPKVFEIQQLNREQAECHEVDGIYILETFLSDLFPILFPLSALTQEIMIKGETFVPINVLDVEGVNISYNSLGIIISQKDDYEFIYINDIYSYITEKLLEWHIDIDSLCDKNLAISVFDLPENPYK